MNYWAFAPMDTNRQRSPDSSANLPVGFRSGERSLKMTESMETNIKPLMTNAFPPGEYREKLIDLFFAKFQSKADMRELLNIAVPAYNKYYTHEEVLGLIEFYSTPLGKKTISVMPNLMGELQEAGRKWGEGLGRDSMIEVLSEHPELEKALEAAKKGPAPQ